MMLVQRHASQNHSPPPPTGLRLQPFAAGEAKVLSITHCHDELKRIFVDSHWGLVFLHHFYYTPVIERNWKILDPLHQTPQYILAIFTDRPY